MIQEAMATKAINFDALADLIDKETTAAENAYSRLANDAHQLRMENQRLRDVIGTINCALDALNLRGV